MRKSNHFFTLILLTIFFICFAPLFSKLRKTNTVASARDTAQEVYTTELVISRPPAAMDEMIVAPIPKLKFNSSSKSVLTLSDIASDSAILYDKSTNTILYSKNKDKHCFPASTTKVITALVAIENVPLDTQFTVGTELTLLQPDSSLAYLNQGNVVTLEDLLYALLLPSGNDAAYVIAVNTARIVSENPSLSDTDAVKYFCSLMNQEAQQCGADNSNFQDPDGYHNMFHYTTAEDMLRIVLKAQEYPVLCDIVRAPYRETNIVSGEGFYWENGNCLVTENNPYFLSFATGFKTGFTDEAGYCMTATAVSGDKDLVAVIFNAPTLKGRYTDAAKLFYSEIAPDKLVSMSEAEVSQAAETAQTDQ